MGAGWGAAHRLSGRCPRYPEADVPVLRALGLGGAAFLDDLQGEVLELGEQGAEFLRIVEQGLVLGELGGRQPAGGGLAADLAGPFSVGGVEPGGARGGAGGAPAPGR